MASDAGPWWAIQEGFVRILPRRGVCVVRKTKREIVEGRFPG
jgi:hypothetical protein